MLSREQVELVRGQIRDALDRGAVIYGESECPDGVNGTYFPATVLVRVDHSMRIMREETFGPVVGVMQVDSMDRAVELANDSDMGLTSSVWSRDGRAAEELARHLRAGVVMINDHLMSHGLAEVPWGGFKASGLGRTHGEIGFDEMTQPQCIVRDLLPGVKRDLWWHPYGLDVYDGLHGIIDLLYAKQPARRLSGLGRVLRLFPRTFED
jgi:acyl-CoA reductase-like NAD-dependent aldehyde dehydrogenase